MNDLLEGLRQSLSDPVTRHAMLIHQGALAFELFTGHPVEADEIREILGFR